MHFVTMKQVPGIVVCLLVVTSTAAMGMSDGICNNRMYPEHLRSPCSASMNVHSPDNFHILFDTNYGGFSAECLRSRAPAWVDRI